MVDGRRRRVEDERVRAEVRVARVGRLDRRSGRRRASAGCRRRVVGLPVTFDPELPQRVAVAGGPDGAVHPHVAAGAGDVERLRAAGAGGGRVDGGPRSVPLAEIWIWNARAYARLPLQHDLADRSACVPRSTWIHCGSLNALDQRVPALPSTALRRRACRRSRSTRRWPAGPGRRWWCRRRRAGRRSSPYTWNSHSE